MTRHRLPGLLRNGASRLAIVAALPLAFAATGTDAIAGPLPTGGQYVAGSGSIAKNSGSLTITQSSNTGIINWSSFSIGQKNAVQFNNGTGATLNRVTGVDPSKIAGSLKATGSLYLINPQGVIVSSTGKVVTGGSFVGSTRDISNDDFLAGKKHFTGSSAGSVSNAGSIRSANGDVALIGNSASNSGSLSAANGTASLNAGNDVLLQPAGSPVLIRSGTGDATNTGKIAAAQAQLNAAGGNVYALAGNNGGVIHATGTQTINGHVWLTSGSGNVSVSGKVMASNADGSGGAVTARANDITVAGDINTSAIKRGKTGGHVSVVATNTTAFSGKIAANGGNGGKGGFVETSGAHVHVADSARVSTLSKDGLTGDWLIDPNDFTIAPTGGDISGAALSTELATTDVSISSDDGAQPGNGDIFVNDTLNWSSAHSLTLNAVRNIDVNSGITMSGAGALNLNAPSGAVAINATVGVSGAGAVNITAQTDYVSVFDSTIGSAVTFPLLNLSFSNNGSISFGATDHGGTLSINSTPYTLLYSMADVQAINTSDTTLQGNYALASSLNASSTTGWVPIGTDGAGTILNDSDPNGNDGFTGVFEGLGHTITNLTVDIGTSDYAGLFGYSAGTIRNLGMAGGSVAGGHYVGGLAGVSAGTLSGVYETGTVTGLDEVGGLAGQVMAWYDLGDALRPAVIYNSYATGDVGGDGTVGGLVGDNIQGDILNSYATGFVSFVFNASVFDDGTLGGLVGENDGAPQSVNGGGGIISQSFATGNVDASGAFYAGGLVGSNDGVITQSFANGTVTSIAGAAAQGGLVGINFHQVDNSYATGAVQDPNGGAAGGLIGDDESGVVFESYSTGAVSGVGAAHLGGFIGVEEASPADMADDYWDTQTSGQTVGVGSGASSGVTGLTTAQLQDGLPTGFASSFWGTGPGLYPYLLFQYPTGTPESVSGFAYSDAGITPLQGGSLTLDINGTAVLGKASSGANGYYYFLVAPDAIPASSQLFAYLAGTGGAALAQNVSGSVTGLEIDGGVLSATTAQTTYSAFENEYAPNLSAAIVSDFDAEQVVGHLGIGIHATGNGFNFDQTILSSHDLDIFLASGNITQTATIAASALAGSAAGSVTLNLANQIATLGEFSAGVSFSLTDALTLNVTGLVTNGTGVLTLQTTGAGHNLFINGTLGSTSHTVTLNSAGRLAEGATGVIKAAVLTGSSTGSATLVGANQITNLGAFTAAAGLSLVDAHTLTVNGTVTPGTGTLTLQTTGAGHNLAITAAIGSVSHTTTLISSGTMGESSAGIIKAAALTGSSVGIATLNSANQITNLGAFAAGAGLSLTDAHSLIVNGTVTPGTGVLTLKTTGAGNNLAIDATVGSASHTVTLIASGALGENSAGLIKAAVLTGSAVGAALNSANQIASLGSFSVTGSGSFSLVDARALAITGSVSVASSSGTLSFKNTSGNMTIQSLLNAATVNLITAGEVAETGSGAIDTHLLNVTAQTGILLNGPNHIGSVGTRHTTSGPNSIHGIGS